MLSSQRSPTLGPQSPSTFVQLCTSLWRALQPSSLSSRMVAEAHEAFSPTERPYFSGLASQTGRKCAKARELASSQMTSGTRSLSVCVCRLRDCANRHHATNQHSPRRFHPGNMLHNDVPGPGCSSAIYTLRIKPRISQITPHQRHHAFAPPQVSLKKVPGCTVFILVPPPLKSHAKPRRLRTGQINLATITGRLKLVTHSRDNLTSYNHARRRRVTHCFADGTVAAVE